MRKQHRLSGDVAHRAVGADVDIGPLALRMWSIYGSDRDSAITAQLVEDIVKASPADTPLLLGGDFNVQPAVAAEWLAAYPGLHVVRPLVPTCRSGGAESVIDFFVVSTALMHLLGPVDVLPSAVATHSIVRLPLRVAGGQKIEEWIRPKAPETVKAFGPELHTPAADAAAFAETVRNWTLEQLSGRPANVGSLRNVPDKQLFDDDAWTRWLALARTELVGGFGDSLGRAAAPYKFESFDPVERACLGVTRMGRSSGAAVLHFLSCSAGRREYNPHRLSLNLAFVSWTLRRAQATT